MDYKDILISGDIINKSPTKFVETTSYFFLFFNKSFLIDEPLIFIFSVQAYGMHSAYHRM